MQSAAVIVVGVDFSPASEQALDAAIRLAKEWKASIELVHALIPLGAPGLDLQHPQFDPPRNESNDVLTSRPATPQTWLKRVTNAGVKATLVTRSGSPAGVIIDEARRVHARTIIVGSHGRGGMSKALLGSVAESVVAKSPVPVRVIPGRGAGAS